MMRLWIESDMSPNDVEDGSADERILDEERVEERSCIHDDVTEEDVLSARDVTSQFPKTRSFSGRSAASRRRPLHHLGDRFVNCR